MVPPNDNPVPFQSRRTKFNIFENEITKQMQKYINNSAMTPNHGQSYEKYIGTILNIHMNNCYKLAIILSEHDAIKLYTVRKHLDKLSFLGKNKMLKTFQGYIYHRYFPIEIIDRTKYIFDVGVFEWWQKCFEYSCKLKLNVHSKKIMSLFGKNVTSQIDGSTKTAVTLLSLIPGTGLLISFITFIYVESGSTLVKRHPLRSWYTESFNGVKKLFQWVRKLASKMDVKVEQVFAINVQPRMQTNN